MALNICLRSISTPLTNTSNAQAYINSHSLKDSSTLGMAEAFFSDALAFDSSVMHEGHRKRYLHSPWVARDLLPLFPKLRIVADLSHWICIAEVPPPLFAAWPLACFIPIRSPSLPAPFPSVYLFIIPLSVHRQTRRTST